MVAHFCCRVLASEEPLRIGIIPLLRCKIVICKSSVLDNFVSYNTIEITISGIVTQ